LAVASFRLGKLPEAQKWCQKAVKLQPSDLTLRLRLFELTLQGDDETALRKQLDEIQHIEGDGGPLGTYGKASLLFWQAKPPRSDKSGLLEARRLLAAVSNQRSAWSRVPLRLADIDRLENLPEQELEHIHRAVKLGERDPAVVRQVVQLLFDRQRYEEAYAILPNPQDQGPLANDLKFQGIAAAISVHNRDYPGALERGQKALADSPDYKDHLWLGQVRAAAGKIPEAEGELRRAVELGEKKGDPWIVLVRYYVIAGERGKAETALKEAKAKLPPDEALLALAFCYEALDQQDQAEKQFQKALLTKPKDPTVLRAASQFYLRTGQPAKALSILQTMLDPQLELAENVVTGARRDLARVYAAGGGYPQFQKALALLDQEPPKTGNSPEALRVRAAVLATRPGRRPKAIELFEGLYQQSLLTVEEQFLLAELYEAEGDWSKARERMQSVFAAHRGEPRYVVPYMRSLLRHKETSEVKLWLDRPEVRRYQTFEMLALKARLLAAQGQADAAVALVTEYTDAKVANPSEARDRLLRGAGLLDALIRESAGRGDSYRATAEKYRTAAEKLYRRYADQSTDPTARLVLADFLARQGSFKEALDLGTSALMTCPPEKVAAVAAVVLHSTPAKDPPFPSLEEWLKTALTKHPQEPAFLLLLAELYERKSYEEAERVYDSILEKDPGNVVARNNLAYLLALQKGKKAARALDLVQNLGGAGSAFLDTRAMAYLARGQKTDAIRDLEEAVDDLPTAVRCLHLS
jgi:tetratricopeptide (TPR) repeat protein